MKFFAPPKYIKEWLTPHNVFTFKKNGFNSLEINNKNNLILSCKNI